MALRYRRSECTSGAAGVAGGDVPYWERAQCDVFVEHFAETDDGLMVERIGA